MQNEKSYVKVDSKITFKLMLDHIIESDIIAYDIETDTLNTRKNKIIGFSISGKVGMGFYLPTMVFKDGCLVENIIESANAHTLAKYLLEQLKGKQLICHNASFDLRSTKNFYGIDLIEYLYVDTAMLVHTVNEEGAFGIGGSPFGLKQIARLIQEYIGLDVEKQANEEQIRLKESIKANGGSVTKDNYEIYKADLDILAEYGAADADLTLRIYGYYIEKLREEGLEKFFFEEEVMPLYKEVTIPMEEKGVELDLKLIGEEKVKIEVDLEKYKALVIEELLKLDKVREWIVDIAVENYPPSKKGTFAIELLKQAGISLPTSEKTGKMSINKANIAALPESTVKQFLTTGDQTILTNEEILKVSLKLWKEDNNGTYFNIQSKDQLGKIAFEVLGLKPLDTTEKGKPKFDDDFIETIGDKYEWSKNLRIYNKLVKIKSTYIDRFYNNHEDGRYYFYFKQNGTVSGRYGSDLQQLPKTKEEGEAAPIVMHYSNAVRAFLVAEKGRILIDSDYESLEPHCFASITGDESLQDIFNKGHDFYSTVAIKTEKLENISADKKAPNYLKVVDPVKRNKAKSYSLGIAYGMESFALAKTLDISQAEAEKLVQGYLDGFPGLKKWREESRKFVKKYGYIKNKVGRIRHLPKVKAIYEQLEDGLLDWKIRKSLEKQYGAENITKLYRDYKNGLNNCLNYQLQSLAAAVVNRAAIAINRALKDRDIDGFVQAQVHDQLIINVPEECAEECAELVKYLMENTTTLEGVTLKAPPALAHNFRDGH